MSILTLHKPDETHIETLYDVLQLKRIRKYTGINELSFNLPSKIQDSKTLNFMDNPDIALIQYDYLIKHDDLYYIIKRINKRQENDVEYYEVTCYGRAYQIKQKRLRDFKTGTVDNPVKNLTDTATLVLSGTIYSIGNVAISLDLKYRAVEIRSNALEGLNKLAEAWDCAWIADDKNKKIHFVDYKIDGGFLGIYLTENNYLKNINLDMREDSIITRLHIYGKNDISIHAVNMGKDYIDDFSFYKNTNYMSQGLISALNAYETAIANNTSQYSTHLTNKNALQATLYTKQNELAAIQLEINLLEKAIDVKRANNEDYSTEFDNLNTKKNQLSTKLSEINALNNQISTIDTNINALVTTLNINNYLSTNQQNELKNYIIEEDFNDNVITEQGDSFEILHELLNAGKEHLSQNNSPRFSAEVDIVALNHVINDNDCKIDADKLELGSIVKVKVDKLQIAIDAKILEIEESFDDYGLEIKIANSLNISDGSYKVDEMIQSLNNSKNLVALNLDNWNQGKEANNIIQTYLKNAIDTSVQNIKTADSLFQLNHRGLVLTSSKDNGKYQTIVNSEGIILSEDYGETWNVGINRGKVNAEVLSGQLVIAEQGIFSGITCLKSDGLSRTILDGANGIKIQKKVGEAWSDQLYTDINGNLVLKGLYSGVVTADQINGGTLTGVTINVSTDATVGDTITLGNPSGGHLDLKRDDGFRLAINDNDVLRFFQTSLWCDGNLVIKSGSSIGIFTNGLSSPYYAGMIRLSPSLITFSAPSFFDNNATFQYDVIFNRSVNFNNQNVTNLKLYSKLDVNNNNLENVDTITNYNSGNYSYDLKITSNRSIYLTPSTSSSSYVVSIGGALKHTGSYLSFFNGTPVSKTSVSDPNALTMPSSSPSTYTSSWGDQVRTDINNLRTTLLNFLNAMQAINLV